MYIRNGTSMPVSKLAKLFSSPILYYRMHVRKSSHRHRDEDRPASEPTDRREKTELEKGRGRGLVQIGARTHVNLSAASRCYRGATLMRCILSILLRAPRRCIWPIVHLSICVATIPLLSSHPSSLPPPTRFCPTVHAPIASAFNYEPHRSANNQMKPLAYCRCTRSCDLSPRSQDRSKIRWQFWGRSFFEFRANCTPSNGTSDLPADQCPWLSAVDLPLHAWTSDRWRWQHDLLWGRNVRLMKRSVGFGGIESTGRRDVYTFALGSPWYWLYWPWINMIMGCNGYRVACFAHGAWYERRPRGEKHSVMCSFKLHSSFSGERSYLGSNGTSYRLRFLVFIDRMDLVREYRQF